MICHLYARFSPRPNAAECESVEKQIEMLKAWCQARGYEVGSISFDKAASGHDRERPGLFDAIESCKRGDMLIVRDWERFSRDRTFAGIVLDDLRKKGVQVKSITEDGDMPDTMESRLLRNILLDIAEYKRGIMAARTKAAMIAHQKRGRLMGTIPYGYEVDDKGILVASRYEQTMVRRIRELHSAGKGYNQIAKYLNAKRFPSRGRAWHRQTISNIVNRDETRLPTVS